jgi:ABC-type molybdate transport system ATPase subunit
MLIDEALSVGDYLFKQKCFRLLNRMREQMSVVLVSHSAKDVLRFCDRGMVMHEGRVSFLGKVDEALEHYHSLASTRSTRETDQVDDDDGEAPHYLGQMIEDADAIAEVSHEWTDDDGQPVREIERGASVTLRARFRLARTPRRLAAAVVVFSPDGTHVTSFNSDVAGVEFAATPGEQVELQLTWPEVHLNPGPHESVVVIFDGPQVYYRQRNPPLTVSRGTGIFFGVVTPRHAWAMKGH